MKKVNVIGAVDRLNEVYRHLYAQEEIETQEDFAAALKMQRSSVSAAINGNVKYLTKNLFQKICATYQGVFNLDYLLTGEGSLLLHPSSPTPSPTTLANDNLLELHAQMIRRVDDLRQELHQELLVIRQLNDELRATLAELKITTTHEYGMAAESH